MERVSAGRGGSAGVTHYFSAPVRVTGASPTTGPENGGTVIGLRGVGFEDGPRLACRFGTTYPVRAAFVGSDLIECISPSADAGKTIPLGSTGNGRDYTPGGGLFGSTATFNYFASLRVTGVTPRSGVTGGRTPVFVTGVGFINSTLLSCRLGREVVAATYLSPFSILCIAPEQPTGAGTVFIEVSNNGEDWTSERTLFHFAPCPAGYYCPEGEPLPCPRGAFCSGGSGGGELHAVPGGHLPAANHAVELPPGAHRLHRAGCRHKRAQRVPARRGVRCHRSIGAEQTVPARTLLPGRNPHV